MLTDEEAAELAALRTRAFGPDADLIEDAASLARLRELEQRAHETSTEDASAEAPAAPVAEPPTVPAAADTAEAAPAGAPEEAASVPSAPQRRTWSRRAVLLVGIPVVGLACAIGAGLGAASAARVATEKPTPTPTLAAAYEPSLRQVTAMYSWDAGSLRLVADLGGRQVWNGTTANGELTCIVVFDGATLQPDSACAPTGALTTAGVGVTVTDPRSRATRTYVTWPNGSPMLTWSTDDPNPSP